MYTTLSVVKATVRELFLEMQDIIMGMEAVEVPTAPHLIQFFPHRPVTIISYCAYRMSIVPIISVLANFSI